MSFIDNDRIAVFIVKERTSTEAIGEIWKLNENFTSYETVCRLAE